MTERFMVDDAGTLIDIQTRDTFDYVFDVCDLLNDLTKENDGLKKQITSLKIELNMNKHPLWSTREAERKVSALTDLLSNETKKNAILLEEINSLRKENMRLKVRE